MHGGGNGGSVRGVAFGGGGDEGGEGAAAKALPRDPNSGDHLRYRDPYVGVHLSLREGDGAMRDERRERERGATDCIEAVGRGVDLQP